MPTAVKDYLDSMKSVSSSVRTQTQTQQQSDLKTQQLLSQLIEAVSYANSINFRQKTLNDKAAGSNPDNKTGREVIQLLKNQEKLISQLAAGQELSKEQTRDLNDAVNRFYELAGAQEINYKKFAGQLEKFALKGNLPDAVQTRLINDSRDAHMIGKEQQDSSGLIMPILKKIRNLLEDGAENTKQFNKRLFVSLDQFREGFLDALGDLKEELKPQTFLGNVLKAVAGMLNGAGMLWMAFQGQFKEGNFKWGTMFKQINNIGKVFKMMKNVEKYGKIAKSPVKAVKDLVTGARLIGKNLASIPKLIKSFGLGKGLGKAMGGIGKGITKGLGKTGLKKIPVIGTIMSLWMAWERWGQKDYAGALIELGSGFAALFPGVGTAISVALDLINLGRDTGVFKNAGQKIGGKLKGNLGENMLLSIPVVGPVVGLIKSIKMWNSGDKKGAIGMAAKTFLSIIPGGAFVADIISSLFNIDASEVENSKMSDGGNKGGSFKWPFGKKKGDNGGDAPVSYSNNGITYVDGPFGDAPVKWQNESGGYSPNGLTDSAKNATSNFNKLIGGGLTVTSAFRDPAKMMPLWNSATPIPGSRNRRNKYGNEMADPRRSNHRFGTAIDVPMGLYRKLGSSRFTKLAKEAGFNLVYPEHSAVHLEVPKTGKVAANSNIKDSISASSSSNEPFGEDDQKIEATGEIQDFGTLMDMFNKFNQELASNISGSASGSAPVNSGSVSPASTPSAPSLDAMSAGTPAAQTAQSTTITASKPTPPPPKPQPMATQSVQTVNQPSQPGTIDTEIRDTDLALLNSLLFQS